MNIHHIVSSIDISTGGPARSVTGLINSILLNSSDIEITLDTIETKEPIISSFINKKGKIFFNKSCLLNSTSLKYNLKKSKSILYHGHGIWQMPIHNMARIARKKNIPYIITPRGMLESWSLKQGAIKKELALKLFQYKDLEKSACIHATADMEVESIRALGFKNPIAMIPNGIKISEFSDVVPVKDVKPRKILFLSRIHKKKGIENLIEAWSNINLEKRSDWIIEIIGNGDADYIKQLNKNIISKKLQDTIFINAPVFGEKKLDIYRKASLFVLPTFSENFGIVVAEALASFTPVITTKGTPWKSIQENNCGWWIDIGVAPLEKALIQAISLKNEKIIDMGINGRKLIENDFSMTSVSKKMIKLYDWILNKGIKPTFVNLYE